MNFNPYLGIFETCTVGTVAYLGKTQLESEEVFETVAIAYAGVSGFPRTLF
jgi:hypothetical protein